MGTRALAIEEARPIGHAGWVDADSSDVAAARSGDVRAFERIYHRHVTRVHSTARRMIGPADADDTTQDVFVRAWEKLDSFRGDSAFGTWLFRLAINVILSRRESLNTYGKRHHDDAEMVYSLAARSTTPDLDMDFESAIERLPPGMREVFVLHDIEGFKHEEIARMLGIAKGTSKSQLHRVRMALRKYLSTERSDR